MTGGCGSSRGCSIARNLAIDHLRRQQKVDGRSSAEECDRPAPGGESPFLAAARSEDAARMAGAMGVLEPIYREALLLRFQEELSLEEIAQVAGAPVSTVSSRIQRGLAMLRGSLKGDGDAI
jgi:RNA polymerase sigma-70 factor, ECF subfamily